MLPVEAEEDLGKFEIEFAASVTAPLFWVLRDRMGESIRAVRSFFSTPEQPSLQ